MWIGGFSLRFLLAYKLTKDTVKLSLDCKMHTGAREWLLNEQLNCKKKLHHAEKTDRAITTKDNCTYLNRGERMARLPTAGERMARLPTAGERMVENGSTAHSRRENGSTAHSRSSTAHSRRGNGSTTHSRRENGSTAHSRRNKATKQGTLKATRSIICYILLCDKTTLV